VNPRGPPIRFQRPRCRQVEFIIVVVEKRGIFDLVLAVPDQIRVNGRLLLSRLSGVDPCLGVWNLGTVSSSVKVILGDEISILIGRTPVVMRIKDESVGIRRGYLAISVLESLKGREARPDTLSGLVEAIKEAGKRQRGSLEKFGRNTA